MTIPKNSSNRTLQAQLAAAVVAKCAALNVPLGHAGELAGLNHAAGYKLVSERVSPTGPVLNRWLHWLDMDVVLIQRNSHD